MKDRKKAAGAGAIIILALAAFAGAKAVPGALPAADKEIPIIPKPEDKALAQELEQARAEAQATGAKLSAVEENIVNAVFGPEFTATQSQLAVVKPILSDQGYEAVIDAACDRAVAQAESDTAQTGDVHVAALTSDEGYHSASWSDLVAEYGPL